MRWRCPLCKMMKKIRRLHMAVYRILGTSSLLTGFKNLLKGSYDRVCCGQNRWEDPTGFRNVLHVARLSPLRNQCLCNAEHLSTKTLKFFAPIDDNIESPVGPGNTSFCGRASTVVHSNGSKQHLTTFKVHRESLKLHASGLDQRRHWQQTAVITLELEKQIRFWSKWTFGRWMVSKVANYQAKFSKSSIARPKPSKSNASTSPNQISNPQQRAYYT